MENNQLVDFAKRLKSMIDMRDLLDEDLKKVKAEIEEFQKEFVELMEIHRMQRFSLDGVGTVYISSSIYPKVVDQDLLFSDLRSKGFETLIKETIHAGTLKAHVKELLADKNELPKGIEVYPKAVVRIRKN